MGDVVEMAEYRYRQVVMPRETASWVHAAFYGDRGGISMPNVAEWRQHFAGQSKATPGLVDRLLLEAEVEERGMSAWEIADRRMFFGPGLGL